MHQYDQMCADVSSTKKLQKNNTVHGKNGREINTFVLIPSSNIEVASGNTCGYPTKEYYLPSETIP